MLCLLVWIISIGLINLLTIFISINFNVVSKRIQLNFYLDSDNMRKYFDFICSKLMEKRFFHSLQVEIDFISYLLIPKFVFYNNSNPIYSFVNIKMIKNK